MQWKPSETELPDSSSIIVNKYLLQLQTPDVMFYRTQQQLICDQVSELDSAIAFHLEYKILL